MEHHGFLSRESNIKEKVSTLINRNFNVLGSTKIISSKRAYNLLTMLGISFTILNRKGSIWSIFKNPFHYCEHQHYNG